MSRRESWLLLALAALPTGARAWERTGIPNARGSCLYWDTRTIPWSAAENLGGGLPESEAIEAIRQSFDEWQRQDCSDLAFREGPRVGRSTGYRQGRSNVNTVVFRDRACADVVPGDDPCLSDESCSNEYDCWDQDEKLIAVTTTTFSVCSGRIVDADIELNAVDYDFATEAEAGCAPDGGSRCDTTDVRNTLVHEIGHVIGLAHSTEESATMYATAPNGETKKRDLAGDDRNALCTIYPADGDTAICPPAQPLDRCGEGSGSSGQSSGMGCSGAAGDVTLFSILAAAAGLVWRRRGVMR